MADDYSKFEDNVTSEPSFSGHAHEGYGATFADESDIRSYRRAIAAGATPEQALLVGDNGIGAKDLGTISTTGVYGISVPRDQLIAMFGSDPAAWRKARGILTLGNKTVTVPIVDEGPGITAQSRGVLIDMTGPLGKYLGATGHDPITVSYRPDAGPDYMSDRAAWDEEQRKFGPGSEYAQYEDTKASGTNEYSQFEDTHQQQQPSVSPLERNKQWAKPGTYVTKLSDKDELEFQDWVKKNNVPFENDTATSDYDMRGFWKALKSGDERAKQALSKFDNRMHFPDVWKTPYHKTFSNESIYATPDAPHWDGDRLIDKSGNVIADETPGKKKTENEYSQYEVASTETEKGNVPRGTQEAPIVSKSAIDWVGRRLKNIWDTSNLIGAQGQYAEAKNQAAIGTPTPNDPWELQIQEIQNSAYLDDNQKKAAIDDIRRVQREHLTTALPDAQKKLADAQATVKADKIGRVEEFADSLVPIVGYGLAGPVGVLGIASQATNQTYSELIDGAAKTYKKLNPGASDGEVLAKANEAAIQAAKASGMSQLALSFVDVPMSGPLLKRIAGRIGVGAASMELAGIYTEVQKDYAINKNIDPKHEIGKRLKDLDFHLEQLATGAAFALPHALFEIGKGGERKTVYPPDVTEDKLGQPDDAQTKTATVEENGEWSSGAGGAGAEEKPTEEKPAEATKDPVYDAYEKIKKRTGFSSVSFADLAKETGLDPKELHSIIQEMGRQDRADLVRSTLLPAEIKPEDRAAALELPNNEIATHVVMRPPKEGERVSEKGKVEPTEPAATERSEGAKQEAPASGLLLAGDQGQPKPETKGPSGEAPEKKWPQLFSRGRSSEWESLPDEARSHVIKSVVKNLYKVFNARFAGIADALRIKLVFDEDYKGTASQKSYSDGSSEVIINPTNYAQRLYDVWRGKGLHWSREDVMNTMFQEEFMHGAYMDFVVDIAERTGRSVGEVDELYHQKIVDEINKAATSARSKGDKAGAELLEKVLDHSTALYQQRRKGPMKFGELGTKDRQVSQTSELIRQLQQIRAGSRLSEAWYRPLWDKVMRDYIRPAIKALRNLSKRINPKDFPVLSEILEESEKRVQIFAPAEQGGVKDPDPEALHPLNEPKLPLEEYHTPDEDIIKGHWLTRPLADRWNNFRNKMYENFGAYNHILRLYNRIKKYNPRVSAEIDAAGWYQEKTGHLPTVLSKEARQLINAAHNGLFRSYGQRMRDGGYRTLLPDGTTRPFYGAPDNVVPWTRTVRPDYEQALEGEMYDPKTGKLTKGMQKLYDDGVAAGEFNSEDDLKKLLRQYHGERKSPHMTSLEHARVGLPSFLYTYSFEAMMNKLYWQSIEIARLEAFDQKIAGSKDAFDRTIDDIDKARNEGKISKPVQERLSKAVEGMRAVAYGTNRRRTPFRFARGLSSWGLASSIQTSMKIFDNVMSSIPGYMGFGRSMKASFEHYFGGKRGEDLEYLREELGMSQDIPINLYDDPYTTKNAEQKAQEFFTKGLRWGGHALVQDEVKSVTARVAKLYLRKAIKLMDKDPMLKNAKTREYADTIRRYGIDPRVFQQTGPVDPALIRRFVRQAINAMTTSYLPEKYPRAGQTEFGSVIIQFGHWGLDNSYRILREIIGPMSEAFSNGDHALGFRYFQKLIGLWAISAVGGSELWRWIEDTFFGKPSHVASHEEIFKAFVNHDGGLAAKMLIDRLWQDTIGAPVFGMFSDIAQAISGFTHGDLDTTHVFNPMNPAAISYLSQALGVANEMIRQGMKMSADQMHRHMQQIAAIIPGYYDTTEYMLGRVGISLPGHDEAQGERDAAWLRTRIDLFYNMTGRPDTREKGMGKLSPHTVYFQNMHRALVGGNVAAAQSIMKRYEKEQKLDPKTARDTMRDSVNNKRPIPGGKDGKAFMVWALKNLPDDELRRMRHIEKVYHSTAIRAGIPITSGPGD